MRMKPCSVLVMENILQPGKVQRIYQVSQDRQDVLMSSAYPWNSSDLTLLVIAVNQCHVSLHVWYCDGRTR